MKLMGSPICANSELASDLCFLILAVLFNAKKFLLEVA